MRAEILVLLIMGFAGLVAPTTSAHSGVLATYRDTLAVSVVMPSDCDPSNSCGHLGGVTVDDYAIGALMATVPAGANPRFRVYDTGGLSGVATDLRVCFYDTNGARLRCEGNGNDVSEPIPARAETARVILVTGADRPYELKLYWNHFHV